MTTASSGSIKFYPPATVCVEPTTTQKTSGYGLNSAMPSSHFNWFMKKSSDNADYVYVNTGSQFGIDIASQNWHWTGAQTWTKQIYVNTVGVDSSAVVAKAPTGNSPAVYSYGSLICIKGDPDTMNTDASSIGVWGVNAEGKAGYFQTYGSGTALHTKTSYGSGLSFKSEGNSEFTGSVKVIGDVEAVALSASQGVHVIGSDIYLNGSGLINLGGTDSTAVLRVNQTGGGATTGKGVLITSNCLGSALKAWNSSTGLAFETVGDTRLAGSVQVTGSMSAYGNLSLSGSSSGIALDIKGNTTNATVRMQVISSLPSLTGSSEHLGKMCMLDTGTLYIWNNHSGWGWWAVSVS
jgi:hypothetical protein